MIIDPTAGLLLLIGIDIVLAIAVLVTVMHSGKAEAKLRRKPNDFDAIRRFSNPGRK